jgi:hypothetical protein
MPLCGRRELRGPSWARTGGRFATQHAAPQLNRIYPSGPAQSG